MPIAKNKGKKSASAKGATARKDMSENGFKRLGHRAGVKRMNRRVHTMNRQELARVLREVIREAGILAESARRKTINSRDVTTAIERQGQIMYGYD